MAQQWILFDLLRIRPGDDSLVSKDVLLRNLDHERLIVLANICQRLLAAIGLTFSGACVASGIHANFCGSQARMVLARLSAPCASRINPSRCAVVVSSSASKTPLSLDDCIWGIMGAMVSADRSIPPMFGA